MKLVHDQIAEFFSPTGRGEENKEFFTNLPNNQVIFPHHLFKKNEMNRFPFHAVVRVTGKFLLIIKVISIHARVM